MTQYTKDGRAYDLSKFDMSAVRKPKEKKPKSVLQKPKTKQELHNERALDSRLIVKVMAATLSIITLLSIQIFANLKLNEYTREYSKESKNLKAVQSENIRLNAAYDAMLSPEKIAEIAEQKYGMVKGEQNQVTYFDLSDSDEVVVNQ